MWTMQVFVKKNLILCNSGNNYRARLLRFACCFACVQVVSGLYGRTEKIIAWTLLINIKSVKSPLPIVNPVQGRRALTIWGIKVILKQQYMLALITCNWNTIMLCFNKSITGIWSILKDWRKQVDQGVEMRATVHILLVHKFNSVLRI